MRILVLGGGYAGLMAALRLANRGLGAQVTLVNDGAEFVERVRLHELAAGTAPPRRPIASLLRGTNVHSVTGRVVALDVERQVARMGDGSELRWDRLVYALGSIASDGGIAGAREHALAIGEPADAARLRTLLSQGRRELVVVGGGLTGIEIASEMAERGHAVALVAESGLGSFFSAPAQAHLRAVLTRMGVRIVDGAVREVREVEVVVGDERLPGTCVWAGGFAAPALARNAGIEVNALGQILVDERLRSLSHPNIYGVGDAASPQFDAGSPIRMGCKYAMPMAAHAAENIARAAAGRNERSFRFGDTGFCVSLGRKEGLIQLSRRDGTPASILTGRLAAFIKEAICRFTVWSLRLERHFAFYRWLPPPRKSLSEPGERRLTA
jgi:NADH:ubiquinone reductase (H+-translocating)